VTGPDSRGPERRAGGRGGNGRDQPVDPPDQPTTALPRRPAGEQTTDEIQRGRGADYPPPPSGDYWYDRTADERPPPGRPPPAESADDPRGRRPAYDERPYPARRPPADYDRDYDGRRAEDRRSRPRYDPRDEGYRDDGYRHEGYRDDGYRHEGYRDDRYPDRYRDERYRDDRYRDDRYRRDPRDYDDEPVVRPGRRTYRDRPYLDAPRAAEPYDYLPPGEPMPGGGALEPAPRHQPVPRGSHLPPYQEPLAVAPAAAGREIIPGQPRKLTVTRVAALRSRQLTQQGVQLFRRATTADGADRSGLTHLTYAVMANYASDAALAVALANTLFFAAATAESTDKVLLYLLITVAPFAIIAPLIGPLLDRLQSGRRFALAASFFARAVLAVIMVFEFDSWVLYPCALGMLVLSKSFGVLKAALTPRVLPDEITLVKTNSRLTVFGLIAGGVAGAFAAALAWMAGSGGALVLTSFIAVAGGVLCLRIPGWVESTEGEVLVGDTGVFRRRRKVPFPTPVTATLWCNGTIRIETGFLALFIAFVVKSDFAEASAFTQLMLLGLVGVAAGIGGFVGNALGARLPLNRPETVSLISLCAVIGACLVALLAPGLATAAIVGLIGSTASSLAKVCLDSVIQRDLPEVSRASAFGRSETALQLSWVSGGVIGLLIGGVWKFGSASVYVVGFGVVTVILGLGLAQCLLVRKGRTMVPTLPFLRRGKGPVPGPRVSAQPRATPTSGAPGARPPGTAGPTGTTPMPPTATPQPATPRPAGSARPKKSPRQAGGKR
jgi:MFS family permease